MNMPLRAVREPRTCALGDEDGGDLLNHLAEYGEEDEDAEHLVLKTTLGVFCVEEREANEEGLDRGQHTLVTGKGL